MEKEIEEIIKDFFAARRKEILLSLLITPLVILEKSLEWLETKIKRKGA